MTAATGTAELWPAQIHRWVSYDVGRLLPRGASRELLHYLIARSSRARGWRWQIGLGRVAEELGYTRRHLRRCSAILQGAGLIRVHMSHGPYAARTYEVCVDRLRELADASRQNATRALEAVRAAVRAAASWLVGSSSAPAVEPPRAVEQALEAESPSPVPAAREGRGHASRKARRGRSGGRLRTQATDASRIIREALRREGVDAAMGWDVRRARRLWVQVGQPELEVWRAQCALVARGLCHSAAPLYSEVRRDPRLLWRASNWAALVEGAEVRPSPPEVIEAELEASVSDRTWGERAHPWLEPLRRSDGLEAVWSRACGLLGRRLGGDAEVLQHRLELVDLVDGVAELRAGLEWRDWVEQEHADELERVLGAWRWAAVAAAPCPVPA